MKKYIRNTKELMEILINKELEKYNTTLEDIKALPDQQVNGVPWYQYYTFDSEEEYIKWKEFCLDILMNHTRPKYPKKSAMREFIWVDLMWGLKNNYETEVIIG